MAKIGAVGGVEIAHGRHTGFERFQPVLLREKDGHRDGTRWLVARGRSRIAGPVVRDVGVRVDESRDAGESR